MYANYDDDEAFFIAMDFERTLLQVRGGRKKLQALGFTEAESKKYDDRVADVGHRLKAYIERRKK